MGGKNIPGRRNITVKSPEVGVYLASSKDSKEAGTAGGGVPLTLGRVRGPNHGEPCIDHCKDLASYLKKKKRQKPKNDWLLTGLRLLSEGPVDRKMWKGREIFRQEKRRDSVDEVTLNGREHWRVVA